MTWPSWRLAAGIGVAGVLLAGVAGGAWLWSAAQHRQATEAYADALARLGSSRGPQPSPDVRAAAVRDLEAALARHPAAALAPQAAYELGNLRYADRNYAGARGVYEVAIARGAPRTLRTLARAGIGYTWEAERNFPKALEAFQAGLAELRPGEFGYEELLVDVARIQELSGNPAAAIATYRRVLRDVPGSLRADDVRSRLASLGARP
jgi:tetratricopeptide (TPR) repeat protein